MSDIRVYKERTNVITIDMGFDVSGDTITSEIRSQPDTSGALIATWTVTFTTDGTDGELTLTIDQSLAANIVASTGYMDLKRVSGGEPIPVFARPLQVEFIGAVTA
jgi:hypothetical protein